MEQFEVLPCPTGSMGAGECWHLCGALVVLYIYVQLQQPKDDVSDMPGQNRPARCGNPTPMYGSLIGLGS